MLFRSVLHQDFDVGVVSRFGFLGAAVVCGLILVETIQKILNSVVWSPWISTVRNNQHLVWKRLPRDLFDIVGERVVASLV